VVIIVMANGYTKKEKIIMATGLFSGARRNGREKPRSKSSAEKFLWRPGEKSLSCREYRVGATNPQKSQRR
jgi:hypothetical protein